MFHRSTETVNDTVRKLDAVEFMIKAWDEVDENVMRKALDIYEEPDDGTEAANKDIVMDGADENSS
jgi:hypothetical protein